MRNPRFGDSFTGQAAFPQSKAFVLQFSGESGPATGLFHGRVEHVGTGDQASFHSTEELWDFVRCVLTSPSHGAVDDAGAPALPAAGAMARR